MSERLAKVVDASAAAAATRGRKAKIAAFAGLLKALPPDDVRLAVGYLIGEPAQGRIGVGWGTLREVQAEPAKSASLTIADLDRTLTALALTTGAGSAARRRQLLEALFAEATAAESDFIRRLLFGEMRHGALEGIVADAVTAAFGLTPADARRAIMLLGDLAEAAHLAATQGKEGVRSVALRVLRPVSPMLAATAGSVGEALGGSPSSVEYKLDGARIQLHRRDGDVAIYTRNLNDVTARLPEIVELARAFDQRQFILDGEVLGFFTDERPQAFQDTMSRFSSGEAGGRMALAAFFFDCLHADGADLIDRPLSDRLEVLDRIVGHRAVPRIVTADIGAAEELLERALAAGHEGVMVKRLDSPYEAGRRGQTWRKVKPVHTLDLVVLGAEWGHGRRQRWLSNLHLGARDDTAPSGYTMVGKTFKGLTDELLEWQTRELLARESDRRGIAVLVRPELVVEIALDGAQQSSRYPGGVALRFARVRRYRLDKPAAHADDLDAVRRLLPRRQ